MNETMCTYIETLHHQLMDGRPIRAFQRERLAELILEEPLNTGAFSRAVKLGEPPESVKGMAAARLIDSLPRKIGPQADPDANWLMPAGSSAATATDALHIRCYFHSTVNSLLTDAYRANEKFLGRPDPRIAKRTAPAPAASDDREPTWPPFQKPILPLEEQEASGPRLEDMFCDAQYDHCFRALVGTSKDPLPVLYFLCRRLDFMPQEQLEIFARRSPEQVLRMVEGLLSSLDHLDCRWSAPLRSRLPAGWPAGLTAKEISNGISRVKAALNRLDLAWSVAA